MKAAVVPWAAASVAAHLVLIVLSGMCRIARPLGGEALPPSTPPLGPEAVVRFDAPPDFIKPRVPDAPFILPPAAVLDFSPDHPEPEEHPDPCDCCFRCKPRIDRPPPELEPVIRKVPAVRVTPPGGVPGDGALLAALRWLARHQGPDGIWRTEMPGDACPSWGFSDFDVGVTALALLTFARADGSRQFGEVSRAAIRALHARQDRDGLIGDRNGAKYILVHALATLALAEAEYPDVSPSPTTRAVGYLLSAQNPGKGWRYSWRCGDNDSKVTAWAILALRAGEAAIEESPVEAYRGAFAWLDEVTSEAYGRVGYTHKLTGITTIPGLNEHFDRHETLTALALAARGSPRHAADLLLRDPPRWDSTGIDFVYWHAGTLALKTVDGGTGPRWEAWKAATIQALLPHQRTARDGCRDGSWDAVDRWSSDGGRVYATAINALTLEALR